MTLTNKDYHFVFFYLVSFLFLFIWQVLMVRKTDTILMVNLVNWKRSTIAVMILILILMTILATTLPFTWSTADGKKSPKSQTQFPHLSDFSTSVWLFHTCLTFPHFLFHLCVLRVRENFLALQSLSVSIQRQLKEKQHQKKIYQWYIISPLLTPHTDLFYFSSFAQVSLW